MTAGLAIRATDLVTPEGLEVSGDFSMEIYIEEVRQDCLDCSIAIGQTNGVWENLLKIRFDDVFPDHLWEPFSLDVLELMRSRDLGELLGDFLAAVISREGKFELELEEDDSGSQVLEISVTLYEDTPKYFSTQAVIPLAKAKAAGMKISVNGEEI